MRLYSIVEPLVSFSYTPLQILGVLAIVGVAIAVVMFFSTLWSVDRTRNKGTKIEEEELIFSKSKCVPSTMTIRRIDREDVIYTGEDTKEIKVTKTRYSYEKTYLQILHFSIGDRHYILDHVIGETVEPNKIVMVGEYSCSASLREDFVDVPYEVTIEYGSTDTDNLTDIMVRMHTDELTHLYKKTDFEFLNDVEAPYPDTLQRDVSQLREVLPGLIEFQTGVRSLLFIMFYKILDPGFRSIGLPSIQNFIVLMSMHIEILRMSNNAQMIENLHKVEEMRIAASTVMIEDAIRRFVTKAVTSKKRRTDIFDILNRYIRFLRDPLAEDYVTQINVHSLTGRNDDGERRYLEKDIHILAISARMYGEILVKLADPDSNLYNEEVSRLYTLITPLQSLLITAKDGDNDSTTRETMDGFVEDIDRYFISKEDRQTPTDLIDVLKTITMAGPLVIPQYATGLHLLTQKVWKSYDLNRRAINSGNRDTHTLLKSIAV